MLQKILYNRGVIDRPIGSKLGQTEPTLQEKLQVFTLLGLLDLEYPIGGADFSRWQGVVDWGKFESELYFAFIQSSYGSAGIDSAFRLNLKEVQHRNVAFGLYHYLKPSADAKKTAQLFYSCWKDSGSQLPPAFDIEQNDGLSINLLNNWMEKTLGTFNDLAGEEVLKVAYSSASFVNGYIGMYPTFDWVKKMIWWIANWTTAAKPVLPIVFSKFAKPPVVDWWQYSSKGIGSKYGASSPNLDLNRSFCKTLAEFNTKYGVKLIARPYTPPPPPPPPSDDTPLGKMWVHTPGGINVRSGPGQSFKDIGDLPYKTIITPIQVDGLNAWIEFEPGKWCCCTLNGLRFLEKLSAEDLAYIETSNKEEESSE
jgi:GH25 family lysozyme M1 (1,4-beta-N-acetylmuramidase)